MDGYPARSGYPVAGWALAAAYLEYASLGPSLAALHLGPYEQSAGNGFPILLDAKSGRW